jgi:transposase-like protein
MVNVPSACPVEPFGSTILLPLKLRPPLRHGPEWTEEVEMASESADPIERWTAKRRMTLVVSILKGEASVAEAARKHGLTVAEVEDWREKFLLGAENALRGRPRDEEALKDEQIKKLKQKIGDLVIDNDILREALKPYPLDRKTSDA